MLLKVIIFLIVFYYLWKLAFRLFFPVVAKKFVEKAQKNMEDRMRQTYGGQNQEGSFQEGEVVIQKGGEKKAGVSDAEGDYVDFEEVKE